MAQNASRKCDFCKKENKNTASLYCYGCEQSLCLECKRDIHERVPIFEDHQLVDINTTGSRVFKPKPVCVSHMNKFLYYCSKCDCLTCKDCMTSSHNGHTTETIKNIVAVYRENAKQIQEKLKAKVEIVQVTLDTITTEQMRQIKSDYDSYVQKVEKTARELYGVVDHIKSFNITAATDFQKIEKSDLHMKHIFYQRRYDELSSTLLQYENILHECHDITFFTEWKRLQIDMNNISEMDKKLQNPRRIESFSEESFIIAVIEEIDKRLKKSILKEQDRKVHALQKEVDDLTKVLKRKETEIENLPHILEEKDRKLHMLQQKVGDLTTVLKQKEAEIENLQQKQETETDILKYKIRHSERGPYPLGHKWSSGVHGMLFCAAIDIGTTHSGYAFSFRNDFTKIEIQTWHRIKLLSLKAPTAILLDSSQQFVAFGYEAEDKYSELVAGEEHEEYYYFHRFKMLLPEKGITRNTTITDAIGKPVQALKVFQLAIGFLKDHLFKVLTTEKKFRSLQEDEIAYFVTVPAIWDDSVLAFMRHAAEASIRRERVALVSESVAAYHYYQYASREHILAPHRYQPGMKYMVVDCGGATVDISVHQKYKNGTIYEVVPARSGSFGGISVDDLFLSFLKLICGAKVIEEFRKTEFEDFKDLFREFELRKRSICLDETTSVLITLPFSLIDLVKRHRGKMEIAIQQSPYPNAVSYSKQKLHISPNTFRDLFKSTLGALIKHIEESFCDDKLSDLENLILVGGFTECELVQHEIKEKFGKNKNIIIPPDSSIAVLKGTVLFGYLPSIVTGRILRGTYGIQSWPEWNPEMHLESKKVDIGGVNRCKDVFVKYVQVGQKVEVGQEESRVFQALKHDGKNHECIIYVSTDPNPRYVTDPSCQRLGTVIIPLPEIRAGQTLDIEGTMIFGDNGFVFKVKELHSGKVIETQFDT